MVKIAEILAKITADAGKSDSASGTQLTEALKEVIQISVGQANTSIDAMEAYEKLMKRGMKVTRERRAPILSFFIGEKEEVRKSLI